MNLLHLCIRRPVLATVLTLIIVLLGIVSYDKLSIREYPNIDEPAVTVRTTYPGASAEIMESQVTKIFEDSIAGIEGIKIMNSISREGVSIINVKFEAARDSDAAASDVRDRVSRVRGRVPEEIDEPIIAKVEADADPILFVVMRSEKFTQGQLTDIANRLVQKQLQNVTGVADAFIFGARRFAMRIWLDPLKLASHQLTVEDVETALKNQNIDIPSGRVEGAQREYTVLSNSDINTAEQFANIVVSNREGHFILLKDIARVSLGVEDAQARFTFNSEPAVGLGVVKQSVANPLEIGKTITAMLPIIEKNLPKGIQITMSYDSSVFIDRSLKNVYRTLLEATALVFLVILVFLRSLRATIIPLVTIPVSLIGAFALMLLFGFTINTLTLLAMVLAIGLVVDDAIVVLENIYRHIENGKKPIEAALAGVKEIGFAIIAMTITLAAVYVPVAFMEGRTGKLFTEFAWTLAGAVVISGFVALTLSPMMCSVILKHNPKPTALQDSIESFLVRLDNSYHTILKHSLTKRPRTLFVMLACVTLMAFLFTQIKSELSPLEDRGVLFLSMNGPEGATTDYMEAYGAKIRDIIRSTPEVNRYGMSIGVAGGRLPLSNSGTGFMGLTDWDDRTRTSREIAAALGPKFSDVPGIIASPTTPASLGAGFFSKPVEVIIKSSTSFEQLNKTLQPFLAKIRENPGFQGIDNDLKINTPQLKIDMDRARLADLGIPVAAAGRALETMLASRKVTRFKMDGEQYDVMVQIEDWLREEPGQLNSIFLRSKSGELVPLSSVVKLIPTVAARDLNHFDRQRAVKITSNLAPGYTLGQALEFLEKTASETLPPTMALDYDGQSREYKLTSSGLYVAFALAIVFIYLVLAAQFESFIDPLIILVTVPMAMLGALAALYLTGNTLNIYSQIGLITLVGLITKHGILMVEFAGQLEERGSDKLSAITQAAMLRLRPILMTTAATVFGALPLAIAVGAGAESRHQIGWVIVGGMSFGTLLTLFVIPAMYMWMHRTK
jgi:multidrug efflux pump